MSATQLQERVTEVLGALWRVDTSEIRVTASNDGIVVLEGVVLLDHDRKAVEAAARRVTGTTAVVSAVSVRSDGGADPGRTWLAGRPPFVLA